MSALQESFRKKSPCSGILASAAMMLLACLQIADARAEVGAGRVMHSGLQIGEGEITTSITQQKTKTVTVVVTDEMGEIAGANIVVKGTSIMNISDMSGKAVLKMYQPMRSFRSPTLSTLRRPSPLPEATI